jgi:phosphotransferase system enzyme I (PtsP)
MQGKPLIFRTLDIGGDKVLSYYHNTKEQNPFLGMRSIRFCLQNKEVFTQQLRAMLRAGRDADLRIMFPMISSLDEFLEARDILNDCIRQLKNSQMQFNPSPQIGMMVELPAVVDLIDDFAKEADFFSIGTNDFIQFMLGVDRTNENVAPFYLPHHPAVLRAINKVAAAANKHNKNISICGDMAHYRRYIPALIGMGITTFSLDPAYMPTIQDYIEKIDSEQAVQMAGKLLAANRVSQTKQIIESGI